MSCDRGKALGILAPSEKEGGHMAKKLADMSVEKIVIVYDGDPVEKGTMDVRDLAPSLLSISELCHEVNRQVHGDDSNISVRVRADFKRGSFGVDLEVVQTWLERVRTLLNDPNTQTARTVIELVFGGGGILALLKWLKGEENPTSTSLESGNIKIEVSGRNNHIEVKPQVASLAKSPKIRKYVDGAIRPLSKAGMKKISVKKGRKTLQTVKRDEATYLLTGQQDEVVVQEGDSVQEVTRPAYLEIVKLSFREDNKWNFGDGSGGLIPASIEDHDFLEKVDRHEYLFGKGDQLKVILRTRTTRMSSGKYQADHTVTKVLEFIPSPQTDLFK